MIASIALPIALSLVSAVSASEIALYWGQRAGQTLGEYCQSSAGDIYIVTFLNQFGSDRELQLTTQGCWTNYPGTELPNCPNVGQDIQTCQGLGKKVLLSLGGFIGSYGFDSDADAETGAQQVWDLFAGGSSSTRPFGDVKLDGFDLDGENNVDAQYYPAFVNKLRELYATDASKSYFVSASPQCPYPDATVGQAVAQSDLDYLFIQYYNNYCSPLNGPNNFNWATWESFAANAPNKNVQLFLGLPGASEAAGSGYIADATTLKQTIDSVKNTAHFGGVSLWDATFAAANVVDGLSYDHLVRKYLDPEQPATTSAPASSSSKIGVLPTGGYRNTSAPASALTTFLPGPTTFAPGNGQTYTVTGATTLTITDCPCTEEKAAPSPTLSVVFDADNTAVMNVANPVTVIDHVTATTTEPCTTAATGEAPANNNAAVDATVIEVVTATTTEPCTTETQTSVEATATIQNVKTSTAPRYTTTVVVTSTTIEWIDCCETALAPGF